MTEFNDDDDFFDDLDDDSDFEFEIEPDIEIDCEWFEEDTEKFMLMMIKESFREDSHTIKLTEELCYDLYCFLKNKFGDIT